MKKLSSILLLTALLLAIIPGAPVSAQSDDVTVTLQAGAAGMKDAQILASNPTTNYGTATNFGVGESNSGTITSRSLLEFDLSGLPRDITIVSATLSLWVDVDQSDNARIMHAYPILPEWTESEVTWNVRKSGSNWQTSGAASANDYDSTSIGQVSMANNVSAGTQVDLTLDPQSVQYMLYLDYAGFKLQMETETNDRYLFKSSDNATAGERPKLVIVYTPDVPIVDPGWQCIDGTFGTAYPFPDCASDTDVISPYVQDAHITSNSYGAGRGLAAAELQCSPFPKCIDDFPIYYRVEYEVSWVGSGSAFAHPTFWLEIPGAADKFISGEITCGPDGSSGSCSGVLEGNIDVTELPVNTAGMFTIGLFATVNTGATLVTSKTMDLSVYYSVNPFDQNCTDIYMVPLPETFEIDPTLETPLGISGTPADDQIYTTVIGQIYMLRVKDGPWNDGTTDSIAAAVSVDGSTWMTWDQFSIDALCIDVDPYHPEDGYRILYFTATTTELHIRVDDTPAAFADNTNDPVTPFSYVIGVAFVVPVPPSCEAQFAYDPLSDTVASVSVPSTDDDVEANNELTQPLEAGGWYGVEVASGSWHETGATDTRIDMEFRFSTGGGLGGSDWADLTDGSGLVQCTSTDGTTVFIQAPAQSGLVLHLRVNDQDGPQDFSDNVGTLGVNIYHASFTRSASACELQFDVGSLVYHDTVAANAGSGKAFATAFASTELDVSFSYGLTPGAWYVLDTTDGPWWLTFDSGAYDANTYYYDAQVRSGTSGTWSSFADWEFTECVVNLDALGHQRVYFQVPADGGIEYFIRVGGANPFGRGEIGWNLYEGVDISPPGGTIDGCADFVYDPDVASGFGGVDSQKESGDHIVGLATNTYRAVQIESANTASDPPYYAASGWVESSGGTESDALQLTSDGTTWVDLPNHPGVLCYFYTPEDEELVFIIQVKNNQDWKLRADSTTFANNEGTEIYRTYPVTAGDALDPWTSCADDYTATVPALNEHEWIPPQDEEGVNLMPSLTYTPGNDPNSDGVILWGDPGLQAGHDYMVETLEGPWKDDNTGDANSSYLAQLSSDGGATWYLFEDHPNVICSTHDQINHYWKAIFSVETGQVWKIRVADTETDTFTDNTGNLAYRLNLVNEFPVEGPGDYVTDYDPGAFDVCSQSLIRPESLTLSEIGSVGNYLSDWIQYINRSILSYFAWCPRHTDLLLSAVNALTTREPLATIAELGTVEKTVMQDVSSYDWDGGYEDTSIFSITSSAQVNNMVEDHILPSGGEAFNIWDGGDLVTFDGDTSLPAYYYSCENAFADYLPSRLKTGVCFASAYWKETGASFWIQIVFDIGSIFLLFSMIKGAVQSLVYMMTGVRPWTKDGAIQIIQNAASGDVVQPISNWRSRR
jgi:hypothetical protein